MLARFQDRFVRTLLAPELPAPPAFAVYRNTVMKGCIDALQANYPSVARLVGEEWFRAAAAVYARANPPRVPMLTEYGAGFAGFLESCPPAAEQPYQPAVARHDRVRSQAPRARLNGRRLQLHAAARWGWFALPAYTIWSANREERGDGGEITWRAQGALITRPRDAVQWIELSADECRFLAACARGEELSDAVPFLARLLQAGAFADQPLIWEKPR